MRYVAGESPTGPLATQSAGLQLAAVSQREYYPLSAGTVPSGTSITLPYGNFGAASDGTAYLGGDPSTLTIAAYDGTTWTNLSATATNTYSTTAKTVTVNLANDLSSNYTALALARTSSSQPLPVALVRFTAAKQGRDGLLSWQTASEQHSQYFEVQASPDASTWQVLTQVAAAGTSGTAHTYSYLDQHIAHYAASVVYYRLRQVDLDGRAYFSPTVSLLTDVATWQIVAYPNPYTTALTAELITAEAGLVAVSLLDATGRVVLQRQLAAGSSYLLSLDEAGSLPTGIYTLVARQNAHVGTMRLVHK